MIKSIFDYVQKYFDFFIQTVVLLISPILFYIEFKYPSPGNSLPGLASIMIGVFFSSFFCIPFLYYNIKYISTKLSQLKWTLYCLIIFVVYLIIVFFSEKFILNYEIYSKFLPVLSIFLIFQHSVRPLLYQPIFSVL
jgi:hypothetical protein